MVKQCPRFRRELPLAEFNLKNRSSGRLQVYCRPCSRAYVRDHYQRNRSYYIEKAKAQKARDRPRLLRFVLEYLLEHPCVSCGETDPAVLEFDHIDPATKTAEVAALVSDGNGWRRVLAEIEKCVVRCANCHRRRTAQQFNWYRFNAATRP